MPVGLWKTVRAAWLRRRAAIRNVERLMGRVTPLLVLLTLMLIGTGRAVQLLLLLLLLLMLLLLR